MTEKTAYFTLSGFFIAIIAAIIAVYPLHQYSFCFSKWRFTTEKEHVSSAVTRIIQNSNSTVNIGAPNPEKKVPFTSLQEFFTLNPDCCEVLPSEWSSDPLLFLDKYFGYEGARVSIKYIERYFDSDGNYKTRPVSSTFRSSSCGTSLDY